MGCCVNSCRGTGTALRPAVSKAGVFEQSGEQRSPFGDWLLRGAVGLGAIFVGWDKFSKTGEWVGIFQQIGLGQWFRYFTGAAEILGGLLVLIPRTATIGLALLACTMLGAVLIVTFVIGNPIFSIFPGAFLIGLVAVWLNRRD